MDPVTIGLVLGANAGLAALKNEQDRKNRRAEGEVQAETSRWSPWTGMQSSPKTDYNPVGTLSSGLMSGAMMAQGANNNEAYNAWLAKSTPTAAVPVTGPQMSMATPNPTLAQQFPWSVPQK